MNPTNTTNPAGARAYTTPDRELIGRIVLESRTAPTDGVIVQRLHAALMSESEPLFIKQAAIYATFACNNRDIAMALLAFIYARAKSQTGESRLAWFAAASETLFLTMRDLSHLRSFIAYYRGPAQRATARWGYQTGIGGRLQKDLKIWINSHPEEKLIKGKAGTAPTTADIFRMVHPGTTDEIRNNVYHWIVKGVVREPNNPIITGLQMLKNGMIPDLRSPVWGLPIDLLGPTIGSSSAAWRILASRAGVKAVLKNLNTYARQLVYADNVEVLRLHLTMLTSAQAIRNSEVSAYEVFRAITSVDESVPAEIKNALATTLELSLINVTQQDTPIVCLVDVSGSMQEPLGYHRGKSSALRRCDAAALIASALTQVSPHVLLVPFDTAIRSIDQLANAEGIAGKAKAIANFMGGGTNVGLAMEFLIRGYDEWAERSGVTGPPNIVLISDNQSLPAFDTSPMSLRFGRSPETRAQEAWHQFSQAHESARLLLIDVSPDGTQQVADDEHRVTGLSGWTPATLNLIDRWISGGIAGEEAAAPVNIVDTITNFQIPSFQIDEPVAPE